MRHLLCWFGVTLSFPTMWSCGRFSKKTLCIEAVISGEPLGYTHLISAQVRLEQKEVLSIVTQNLVLCWGVVVCWTDSFTVFPLFSSGRRPAGRASLQNHVFLSEFLDPSDKEVLGFRFEKVQSVLLFQLNMGRNLMRVPQQFSRIDRFDT